MIFRSTVTVVPELSAVMVGVPLSLVVWLRLAADWMISLKV